MQKEKILEAQKLLDEEIKALLISYRDGEVKTICSKNEGISLVGTYDHLRDLMEDVGFNTLDDTEFNGWQGDYWETYEYNGKKHSLFGTMATGYFELSPFEED